MFTFTQQGRAVRGLVLGEALETVFSAQPGPDGWMQTFHERRRQILALAAEQEPLNDRADVVILRSRDFPTGQRATGRAATAGRRPTA